jgi:outer membrane protein
MHLNTMLRPLAIAAVFALGAVAAHAQVNKLKAGVAHVDINNTTTGVKGIGVPPGADLEVEDATTLFFGYERMLTPNIGIELAAGIPPTHDTKASGSIAFLGKVSSVKQAGPTVFANYHFGDEGQPLRPYVGLGINYTRFFDAKSEYGQDIELSDSWGLAGHLGASYALTKEWAIEASFAMAKVKSDLVATGTTVHTTTIDFKPRVFILTAVYSF